MKPHYNLSTIMRNAWYLKKASMKTQRFGECLRKAWRNEKTRIIHRLAEGLPIEEPKTTYHPANSPAFVAGCLAYYQNAPAGTYFGD